MAIEWSWIVPNLIEFADGPFVGQQPLDGCPPHLALPLNEDMQPSRSGSPFALAIYRLEKIDGVPRYHFMHVQTPDNQPFLVEFADGPIKGVHPFPQPIHCLPKRMRLPLADRATPFSGLGSSAAVAIYERRGNEGQTRYHLLRIDTSDELVSEVQMQVKEKHLQQAVRRFYSSPRNSIYSVQPTDKHMQVSVEDRHRYGEVDEDIASLILELWRWDFDTLGSCQEQPSGKAYVAFPFVQHGEIFYAILREESVEASCEPRNLTLGLVPESTPDEDPTEKITLETLSVSFSPTDLPRISDILRERRESRR